MSPARSTRYRFRLGCCTVYAAKDCYVGIGLFLAIVGLGVMYFGYTVPYSVSLSDEDLQRAGFPGLMATLLWYTFKPSLVLIVLLYLSTEGWLLYLVFADPGIVDEPEWHATGQDAARLAHLSPAEADVHYCPICHVWVLGFDHHCGIVGACIGARTMPVFVTFLTSAWLLLGYGFVMSIVPAAAVAYGRGELTQWPPKIEVLALLPVACACIWLGSYTFLLGNWYTVLACKGQYTLERRRRMNMGPEPEACTTLPRKYDMTRSCKLASFKEMMAELRNSKLAVA